MSHKQTIKKRNSVIETVARKCIAGDFYNTAKIYGHAADREALTATRD
ncbi:DUF5713 family protein [Microbulbifer sp. ANSA003]